MNQQLLDLDETKEAEKPEGFERAMPFEVEQRAALYGLAQGLLALGNTQNKKQVKKSAKQLKRDVIAAIGQAGGVEILEGNKASVMNIVNSINNTPINKLAKRALKESSAAEWRKSFNKGYAALYG